MVYLNFIHTTSTILIFLFAYIEDMWITLFFQCASQCFAPVDLPPGARAC